MEHKRKSYGSKHRHIYWNESSSGLGYMQILWVCNGLCMQKTFLYPVITMHAYAVFTCINSMIFSRSCIVHLCSCSSITTANKYCFTRFYDKIIFGGMSVLLLCCIHEMCAISCNYGIQSVCLKLYYKCEMLGYSRAESVLSEFIKLLSQKLFCVICVYTCFWITIDS